MVIADSVVLSSWGLCSTTVLNHCFQPLCLIIPSALSRIHLQSDQKFAADEAMRKQRLLDSIASIDASRRAQLSDKAEAKANERADDDIYVAAWTQRTQELKQEEEAEVRAGGGVGERLGKQCLLK